MSVQVHNVTLVDNGMGILPIVFTPPSLWHRYSDKAVEVRVSEQGETPFLRRPDFLSPGALQRITLGFLLLGCSDRGQQP